MNKPKEIRLIIDKKYIVYEHVNKINGKKYIGITCQTLNGRSGVYGQNYKNKYFKNAIQKYKWDGFEHNILYSDLNENDAKNIEIELIEKYKTTDRRYGYNTSKGGDTGSGLCGEMSPMYDVHKYGKNAPHYGMNHSEESKRMMSIGHKKYIGELNHFYGKHHKDETKQFISEKLKGRFSGINSFYRRAVINLDTNEIFSTLEECVQKYNIKKPNLVKVCKGERKTVGGYRFSYYDESNE